MDPTAGAEGILATLLTAYALQIKEPHLDISIHLLNWFSSFRLDISTAYAVVTKEDDRAPGMRCDKGTYFYKSYLDDLRLSASQGISLPKAPPGFDPDSRTAASVRDLFKAVGLNSEGHSDDVWAEIILIARSATNPYA